MITNIFVSYINEIAFSRVDGPPLEPVGHLPELQSTDSCNCRLTMLLLLRHLLDGSSNFDGGRSRMRGREGDPFPELDELHVRFYRLRRVKENIVLNKTLLDDYQ